MTEGPKCNFVVVEVPADPYQACGVFHSEVRCETHGYSAFIDPNQSRRCLIGRIEDLEAEVAALLAGQTAPPGG